MNRLKTAALLASAFFALAPSGVALGQDTGNEVTVNPVAPGGGGGMLLYPGGQYMRLVPPLLEPGQNPNAPIHLHMPGKRPAVTASASPRPARRAPKLAAASPAPAEAPPPEASGGFSNLMPGMPSAPLSAPPPAKPTPAPRQEAAKPAAKAAKPTEMAKAEPAPPSPPASASAPEPVFPGMTKRSMIQFQAEQTDPAQTALGAIKYLAADLNTAMTGPGSRIELIAYGGARGDKGSDARRLSLKRALAIRQVLIDDGVPAERIDVHAAGGVDDSGPADRVDVYIKV